MKHVLLMLLAAVAAIILWNAGAAVIGAVPLFLLCLMGSVGTGHARKIGELMQQYADKGDRSSAIFELPEKEAQGMMNAICELSGASLHKTRRDYTITLTAQSGFFWYFGGSAKVLCRLTAKDGEHPPLQTRLAIRYKQQIAVRALRIISIK